MQKIMLATDFSERSDRALRRAILLARQFGADLAIIHVVDDDQPRQIVKIEHDEAEELLRQTADTLRKVDGVASETRVVLASPFAGIITAVNDAKPDLLVIGPHRRQMLKDVFIGTTAERTIRLIDCPVLMVNAPPTGPYQHVIQTTDLSNLSGEALERFLALGIGQDARQTLLYVFDAPALRLAMSHMLSTDDQKDYITSAEKDASRNLTKFLAAASLGSVTPMVRYNRSTAHHEIQKAAEAERADLVVLSTHGRTGLEKMLIGSVTEHVLRTSSVDILAIPPVTSA